MRKAWRMRRGQGSSEENTGVEAMCRGRVRGESRPQTTSKKANEISVSVRSGVLFVVGVCYPVPRPATPLLRARGTFQAKPLYPTGLPVDRQPVSGPPTHIPPRKTPDAASLRLPWQCGVRSSSSPRPWPPPQPPSMTDPTKPRRWPQCKSASLAPQSTTRELLPRSSTTLSPLRWGGFRLTICVACKLQTLCRVTFRCRRVRCRRSPAKRPRTSDPLRRHHLRHDGRRGGCCRTCRRVRSRVLR
jgi:hypothetical protein